MMRMLRTSRLAGSADSTALHSAGESRAKHCGSSPDLSLFHSIASTILMRNSYLGCAALGDEACNCSAVQAGYEDAHTLHQALQIGMVIFSLIIVPALVQRRVLQRLCCCFS